MIRSRNSWVCDGCGGDAVTSCGHGLPVCKDCDPTEVCGGCFWEASEKAAENVGAA